MLFILLVLEKTCRVVRKMGGGLRFQAFWERGFLEEVNSMELPRALHGAGYAALSKWCQSYWSDQ